MNTAPQASSTAGGLTLDQPRSNRPPSREPPATAASGTPAERLAARIEAQLAEIGRQPLPPTAPQPEVLAAYPPEVQPHILELHARAFQAHMELRQKTLDLVREQGQLELRRIELEHQRADREAKLAERRAEADARLRVQVARSATEGIEARQRLGLHVAIAALIAAATIGVFSSPLAASVVATGALVSWLVSQRSSHRTDPALRALPGGDDPLHPAAIADLGELR